MSGNNKAGNNVWARSVLNGGPNSGSDSGPSSGPEDTLNLHTITDKPLSDSTSSENTRSENTRSGSQQYQRSAQPKSWLNIGRDAKNNAGIDTNVDTFKNDIDQSDINDETFDDSYFRATAQPPSSTTADLIAPRSAQPGSAQLANRLAAQETNEQGASEPKDAPLSVFNAAVSNLSARRRNELVACCHSLAKAGFADTPLEVINQHIFAARRWHQSLVELMRDTECRRFYPKGLPSVQNLHRLAVFHNKPVRPPKRFICSVHAPHARKRAPHVFREAFSTSQIIQQKLATFSSTFDISALLRADIPTTLAHLTDLHPQDAGWLNRLPVKAKLARRALAPLLHHPDQHPEQDDTTRLIGILEECERFAHHAHYRQMLGDLFTGVTTHWQSLNQQIGFSQSVLDVLDDHTVAGDVIQHWNTECEAFYQFSRAAALVSRRVSKLTRLVHRLNPSAFDTEVFVPQSARAIERISLWRNIVTQSAQNHEMTPRMLLQTISPKDVSLVELTP